MRFITLVWLGFYSHDLHKPTHLLSNLRLVRGTGSNIFHIFPDHVIRKFVMCSCLSACYVCYMQCLNDACQTQRVSWFPCSCPARTIADMRRTMRTADRKRIARRFELRQQTRATPKAHEVATNWFGDRCFATKSNLNHLMSQSLIIQSMQGLS